MTWGKLSIGVVALGLTACGGALPLNLNWRTAQPAPTVAVATFSLENGMSSIDLTSSQTLTGKVYYAVYDADQSTLSAADVKAVAESGSATNLVANGSVTLSAANTNYKTSISGLAEKKLYYVYAVNESSAGLGTVKKYSKVLPNQMPQLTFPKVTGAEAGQTMRQIVHLPAGYYDNPSKNYPVILWIHGGGEASNYDPSNTGSEFSLMKKAGPFKLLQAGVEPMSAIMIATQCNSSLMNCSNQQRSDLHKEGLDNVVGQFRVDSTRIYVMGMSWGGAGAFTFGVNYPSIPAAIVGIATNPAEAPMTLCNTIGAANIPVWGFLNKGDSVYGDNMSWAINGMRGCYTDPKLKPRVTFFTAGGTGTWPNTIEGHGSAESLTLRTPFYDYSTSAYKYWNGSSTVNDTDPPTHLVDLAPELFSSSPGMSPATPISIQTDSFVTASADLGVSINSVWDWLSQYHK